MKDYIEVYGKQYKFNHEVPYMFQKNRWDETSKISFSIFKWKLIHGYEKATLRFVRGFGRFNHPSGIAFYIYVDGIDMNQYSAISECGLHLTPRSSTVEGCLEKLNAVISEHGVNAIKVRNFYYKQFLYKKINIHPIELVSYGIL